MEFLDDKGRRKSLDAGRFQQTLILLLISSIATGLQEYNETNVTQPLSNVSDVKKDMYVIHAMVYQVGIITNKTSNETDTNLGKQEAVTFFHSNGSKLDFSKISQPILTNVTAQSIVGLIPNSLTDLKKPLHDKESHEIQMEHENYNNNKYKRSNANTGSDNVKIVKGSAVIPKEADVRSIAIPPLLAFNSNFTNIPVPIPNTSVVHYDKINTLVHIPGV